MTLIAKSSTALPFSLVIESPTSTTGVAAPKRIACHPYLVLGSVIFLLGSAPADLETAAPSAVRPLQYADVEADAGRTFDVAASSVERAVSRLQLFRAYAEDWDGYGALAANEKAIDRAVDYVSLLEAWHPIPLATLSRDGAPILEFEDSDTGTFSSITFLPDDNVELYVKRKDRADSQFLSGAMASIGVVDFVLNEMNLPTM